MPGCRVGERYGRMRRRSGVASALAPGSVISEEFSGTQNQMQVSSRSEPTWKGTLAGTSRRVAFTCPTTAMPAMRNGRMVGQAGRRRLDISCQARRCPCLAKKWCCQHFDRGCQGSQAYDPRMKSFVSCVCAQDCAAGAKNWRKGWSDPKKHWCCERHKVGCHVPLAAASQHGTKPKPDGRAKEKDSFTCLGSTTLWSAPKKVWCCAHYSSGCQHGVPEQKAVAV